MRLTVFIVRRALLAAFLTAVGTVAAAQTTPQGGGTPKADTGKATIEVQYDHAGTKEDRAYSVMAAAGDTINVKIVNTCSDFFEYGIETIKRAAPPIPADRTIPGCKAGDPSSTKSLPIVYDSSIGSYIVNIKKKDSVSAVAFTPDSGVPIPLENVRLVINVNEKKWDYEMSGAFTTSSLTDPKFGIEMRPDPNPPTTPSTSTTPPAMVPFVVRDRSAEDKARLGVAAFIHLFNTARPAWALTFGLGINEANKTTYFTGISRRFGEAGAFTIGGNFGSVDRLPPGTSFDKPVAATILSNLGSRVNGGVFFALSYKFLNPSGRLQKPFQEVQTPGGGSGTPKPAPVAPAIPPPGPSGPNPPAASVVLLPAPNLNPPQVSCNPISVTLTWDAVAGATSYEVLRSSTSCNQVVKLDKPPITVTEFKDTSLTANTTFHYRVRAFNGEKGDSSVCQSITTTCP